MNWKNVAENLGIALIGVLFGSVLTYFTITQANKALTAQLRPVIEQAIAKETTAITNEFKTEIKKLKAKGASTIELTVEPEIENKAQTNIEKDSAKNDDRGFFGRLFGKKKQ